MQTAEILEKYMPAPAVPQAVEWLERYRVQMRITAPRKTKLGDYRAPYGRQGHRISVNSDLNPYSFLITFVHEMAHLLTWERHRRKASPHGSEWKQAYRELMLPILQMNIFPDDVAMALSRYMRNPAASSCNDTDLYKTLSRYNSSEKSSGCYLEELSPGTRFALENGRQFTMLKKLRKFYLCSEVDSGRHFRISPLMQVYPLNSEGQG